MHRVVLDLLCLAPHKSSAPAKPLRGPYQVPGIPRHRVQAIGRHHQVIIKVVSAPENRLWLSPNLAFLHLLLRFTAV